MRKTILQSVLNALTGKKFVEINSDNLKADHRGYDKILRSAGLKEIVGISTDKDKSSIIFYKK